MFSHYQVIDIATKRCKSSFCMAIVTVVVLGLLTWTGANSSETVEKLAVVAENQVGIKGGILKLEETINTVGLRVAENTAKNSEQDERLRELEEENREQEKRIEELEEREEATDNEKTSPVAT